MPKDNNQNTSSNQDIPEMNLENKYSEKKPIVPQNTSEAQKKLEKTKKELDKLKNWIIKKYPFVQSIGLLPPQAIDLFVEEEELGIDLSRATPDAVEKIKKKQHLYIIIPEEEFTKKVEIKKDVKVPHVEKIRGEIIKQVDFLKLNVWLHLKSPVNIWESCMDSKFTLVNAISMSYPLYDTGFLGSLRVAEIHKEMMVQKFERYIVSYVIAGSLVRGEAIETSDVDVFVVIDDTDVKKMSRIELRDRLRSWAYKFSSEAAALAGVKNTLNIQVYLLTEFWESVKDANPVMFTFIRDGIPLFDKGTFTPWKALLRMGRLKPSPEAIDMFMSMGNEVVPRSKRTLMTDVFTNIFWGVTTPAQALIMLNGGAPPNPKKELIPAFKKAFYDTKMIEKKHIDFLDKVIKTWRDYEHEKIKEIKGAEIDKFIDGSDAFLKRLKELKKQIEEQSQVKTVEQVYKQVFDLAKIVVEEKVPVKILSVFEKDFVKKGKFTKQHLKVMEDIFDLKKTFKKGKTGMRKVDEIRRNSANLVNALTEYTQRSELLQFNKGRMVLKYKEGIAELLNVSGKSFLVRGSDIKEINAKLKDVAIAELTEAVEKQKDEENVVINPKIFYILCKELGDFEIII